MKKSLLLGVLLLTTLVVLISACSSAATPASTSDPATTDSPAIATEDPAKALIEERCSVCHTTNIVYDASFDESGWSDVIDLMIEKGAVLSEEEKTQIIDWLLAQP